MRVAVIGAGPAGICAAYELSKAGIEVEVFDLANVVGGMCRSITLWEKTVDIGSHIFSPETPQVKALWSEVVGDDYRYIDVKRAILTDNGIYPYPLKFSKVILNNDVGETLLMAFSYLHGQLWRVRNDDSAKAWVIRRFGHRLFERFFRYYAEKLSGISCEEIDADFARMLFGEWKPNIQRLISNLLHPYLTDVKGFPWPNHGGTGKIWENIAIHIINQGGQIRLSTQVEQLITEKKQVTGLTVNGEKEYFDHIISSMPITKLVSFLGEHPDEIEDALHSLRYRNTVMVFLHVPSVDTFPYSWIYIYPKRFQVGRVTNFHTWISSAIQDNTILALEYWCYEDDALWQQSDTNLIKLATDELQDAGLLKSKSMLEGQVMRFRNSHPVYNKGYRTNLKRIQDYLHTYSGISTIGRHGTFTIDTISQSMQSGLNVAKQLLS